MISKVSLAGSCECQLRPAARSLLWLSGALKIVALLSGLFWVHPRDWWFYFRQGKAIDRSGFK